MSEKIYLDQDPELRGQKYYCVSFISPEDVLMEKEVFIMNRFLEKFSIDMKDMFNNLHDKFKDDQFVVEMLDKVRENHGYVFDQSETQQEYNFFKNTNDQSLEEEFHHMKNFTTSIRGIKVRGFFDNVDEAKNHAAKMIKIDPYFNIYIGTVGCWCPWNPAVDSIQTQEWANNDLNLLMKEYKEKEAIKQELYDKRKLDLMSTNKTEE